MFSDLKRYGRDPTVVVRSKPPTFNLPLKRVKGELAIRPGWKVFTCSWSDWFHKHADPWREEAWDIIRQRRDVIFQIVTKRTDRIPECLPPDWGDGWPHVWLIATVETQHWAQKRVPELLRVPAAVHGLSCEPLLGPIDLMSIVRHSRGTTDFTLNALTGRELQSFHDGAGIVEYPARVDWVIAGGESGHHARPTHPDWIRSMRDRCQAAGVPFFFKQWGEHLPFDQCAAAGVKLPLEDAMNHAQSGAPVRVGKKQAGRLLDGREWSQFPSAAV